MNARETLLELAVEAQSGRDVRERTVRAGCLIQASELLRFLQIAVADYDEASRRLTDHAQRSESMAQRRAPGPRLLEPDEIASAAVGEALDAVLYLRIETFYVFAKVLLDKLAQAVQGFFGHARGASLSRHSKLRANLGVYASLKNLSPPVQILELAESLDPIVAFRDEYVVHVQSPRLFKMTTGDADGRHHIASGQAFPGEIGATSANLDELLSEVEVYVEAICAYLRQK